MSDLIDRLREVAEESGSHGYGVAALLRKAADALEAARKDACVGSWNSSLHCTWLAWRALSSGEIALDMPADCCCDMTGAIKVGESLMPGVWRIATFAGGIPDTEYRCLRGEWKAYDAIDQARGKGVAE